MTSKTIQFLQSAFAKVASVGLALVTTLHAGMLGSNIAILNGATFDQGLPIVGAGVVGIAVGLFADRYTSRKFSQSKPKHKWGARAALAAAAHQNRQPQVTKP